MSVKRICVPVAFLQHAHLQKYVVSKDFSEEDKKTLREIYPSELSQAANLQCLGNGEQAGQLMFEDIHLPAVHERD